MSWRVEWSVRAERDLARLDLRTQHRIVGAVNRLAESGHGDVRQLQGSREQTFRLRVGDWRVLFTRERARLVIHVLRVRPRGDAYRS